jgi:hypothetical protein
MSFLIEGHRGYRRNYINDERFGFSEEAKNKIWLFLEADRDTILMHENDIKLLSESEKDGLFYLAYCEGKIWLYPILLPFTSKIPDLLYISFFVNIVFNRRINKEDGIRIMVEDINPADYDILFLLAVKTRRIIVLKVLVDLMEKTEIEKTIQSMTPEYIQYLLEIISTNTENENIQKIKEFLPEQKIGE